MSNNPENNEIQIALTDEIAQGTYANLVVVSHSPSEFVLDFIRVVPGAPKADVKSRIILTADNARRLLYTLRDNLQRFDEEAAADQLPAVGGIRGEA